MGQKANKNMQTNTKLEIEKQYRDGLVIPEKATTTPNIVDVTKEAVRNFPELQQKLQFHRHVSFLVDKVKTLFHRFCPWKW